MVVEFVSDQATGPEEPPRVQIIVRLLHLGPPARRPTISSAPLQYGHQYPLYWISRQGLLS